MRIRPVVAGLLDAVSVGVFAAVGTASHQESGGAWRVAHVAWPFLAGAAVGWLGVAAARRRAPLGLADGAVVWGSTLVVGMLLRVAAGGGIAVSFVVVAAVALAVLLLGWRAVAAVVGARRRTRV